MKAAESVDGEEKRETSRTSLGGLVEVSREVLTRLSALAWVQQGARYTYVTGGLFTTPSTRHLLLDSKLIPENSEGRPSGSVVGVGCLSS